MKRVLFLAVVLVVAGGCAQLCGTLDAAASAQNEQNVRAIAAENAELGPKAGLAAVSLEASRLRNEAAIELASKMAKDAAR